MELAFVPAEAAIIEGDGSARTRVPASAASLEGAQGPVRMPAGALEGNFNPMQEMEVQAIAQEVQQAYMDPNDPSVIYIESTPPPMAEAHYVDSSAGGGGYK